MTFKKTCPETAGYYVKFKSSENRSGLEIKFWKLSTNRSYLKAWDWGTAPGE